MFLKTFPVGLFQCNCSILGDEQAGTAIVIDPGDEAERIVAELSERGLSVQHVLHTHAHIDHLGGTGSLLGSSGARARVHRGDEWLVDHLEQQAGMVGLPAPPAVTVDEWLSEGDRFAIAGSQLEVLHTPGHTPGSCSFVLENDGRKLIFSGDTLFAGSIGRTDLWGGDPALILKSLQGKLMSMEDDAEVICGHGPATSIGHERRTNPFLNGQWRIA